MVIEAEHLKKYFGDVKAVDDVSFSVKEGELFGFLGVNGAGKSTTINILCTLLAPTSGSVRVCGRELGREDNEIKRHIGVVYQNNCLDKLLTVKENLLTRGSLYENDRKQLLRSIERVSAILELGEILKRPYGKLSGGQKRRCEIAAALLHSPDILFLDEPTTGLDPAARKNVWETISGLRKETGMTVFLTTHYMEEAAQAEHIAIMDKGHLTRFGTPFELKEKYARDRLVVTLKGGGSERLLSAMGCEYSISGDKAVIDIPDTMSALPLLNKIQDIISGFEVVQGTLDDVFLSVTGGAV
ncbi:MAG: ABC transporter ATP-binding protein [Oscillospiraceae bacterium]|nr:ABC transporter ATP-binding protein [Oscillospiraceae bacterium]